jgi:molecular chaperone DnaJ/curved DNA-binding protein
VQFKDYYQTLGVSRDASADEIKKAYRRLARKYHPDVYTGTNAEEKFKEINEANQVLSDPEKRARYDRFGADWERYQGAPQPDAADFSEWFTGAPGGGNAHFDFQSGQGGTGFSDFFDLLFGSEGMGRGRRGMGDIRPQPVRGEDQEHSLLLPLAEALSGTTRTFEISTSVPGGAPDRRKIEVTIPAGVRDGSRVRVAGKGGPGRNGGPPGDVYLRVKLREHPRFALDGNTLRVSVDVPLYTAVLGGEVVVPLLSGKRIAVTVPSETQNGRTIRLRGQGWPKSVGSAERGDLIVKVNVLLPENLSPRERELFEELATLRDPEAAREKAAA